MMARSELFRIVPIRKVSECYELCSESSESFRIFRIKPSDLVPNPSEGVYNPSEFRNGNGFGTERYKNSSKNFESD